jgi:hypothetical protein
MECVDTLCLGKGFFLLKVDLEVFFLMKERFFSNEKPFLVVKIACVVASLCVPPILMVCGGNQKNWCSRQSL